MIHQWFIKNNIDDEPSFVNDNFQLKKSISIPSTIDQWHKYSDQRSLKIVIVIRKIELDHPNGGIAFILCTIIGKFETRDFLALRRSWNGSYLPATPNASLQRVIKNRQG